MSSLPAVGSRLRTRMDAEDSDTDTEESLRTSAIVTRRYSESPADGPGYGDFDSTPEPLQPSFTSNDSPDISFGPGSASNGLYSMSLPPEQVSPSGSRAATSQTIGRSSSISSVPGMSGIDHRISELSMPGETLPLLPNRSFQHNKDATPAVDRSPKQTAFRSASGDNSPTFNTSIGHVRVGMSSNPHTRPANRQDDSNSPHATASRNRAKFASATLPRVIGKSRALPLTGTRSVAEVSVSRASHDSPPLPEEREGIAGILFSTSAQNSSGRSQTGSSEARERFTESRSSTSTASGDSARSSTWAYLRGKSSSALNRLQGSPQQNDRTQNMHSASYASLRALINSDHEAVAANLSMSTEPRLSPILDHSGTATPLAATEYGISPSVAQASHRLAGLGMRSRGWNAELRQSASSERLDAVYHVQEQASLSSTNDEGSNRTRRGGISALNASRRRSSGGQATLRSSGRRAEGLVAMAIRHDAEASDSKVVIAGRNVLKVLSINQGRRSWSVDDDESQLDASGWSPPSLRTISPYVKVSEEIDLQAGLLHANSRNSKAALINDVSWGYGLTSSMIMTGNSNGTVALYDVGKAGNKLDRLKTMHTSGRPINVSSFGGAPGQGTLIASGCQDGDIKVSDIRHSNLITLSMPLDPVRSICFPPRDGCVADPYSLVAAYESGNLVRWDLRNPKAAVDRILAHQGGVLTLDWRGSVSELKEDNRSSVSDGWGWLVTGGMDGTAKVWDVSTSTHSPRLVHTLQINRPVHFARWHSSPGRTCEIVVLPAPATSAIGNQLDQTWQPTIEIWDVRREHLAKEVLWIDSGIVSAMAPPNKTGVLYSLSKTTSTFRQIDLAHHAVSPASFMPRSACAWSPQGSLALVLPTCASEQDDVAQSGSDSPILPSETMADTSQTTAVVASVDPTFDERSWAVLSVNYHFQQASSRSVSEACDVNAQVAQRVGRTEVAQMWRLLADWCTAEEVEHARRARELRASGSTTVSRAAEIIPVLMQKHRMLRKKTSNAPERHGRTHRTSPLVQSETLPEEAAVQRSPGSSLGRRRGGSNSAASSIKGSKRTAHHLAQVTTRIDETEQHSTMLSRNSSGTVRHVSGASSASDEPEGQGQALAYDTTAIDSTTDDNNLHENTEQALRQRARKMQADLQRQKRNLPSTQSRATSANAHDGKTRRVGNSTPAQSRSRSASSSRQAWQESAISRQRRMELHVVARQQAISMEMSNRMRDNITKLIHDCVDIGDIQTAAVVALLMQQRLELDASFFARLISSYVRMLRLLDCHTNAAGISKTCNIREICTETQDNTTLHTSCGRCGRGLLSKEYGYCSRCRASVTVCSVCHTRETEAYLFCPTCGHGAHEPCLLLYAEARLTNADPTPHISPRSKNVGRFSSATDISSTAPASPAIASTPTSGHWLYPNEHALFQSANASRTQSRAPSPNFEDQFGRNILFSHCPAGCGHQCSLSLPAL